MLNSTGAPFGSDFSLAFSRGCLSAWPTYTSGVVAVARICKYRAILRLGELLPRCHSLDLTVFSLSKSPGLPSKITLFFPYEIRHSSVCRRVRSFGPPSVLPAPHSDSLRRSQCLPRLLLTMGGKSAVSVLFSPFRCPNCSAWPVTAPVSILRTASLLSTQTSRTSN